MMKDYKYWFYYLKDNNELYAYTDDKVMAQLFESQRNMEKFDVKIKKIDKEDVNMYAKEFQCLILELVPVDMYDRDLRKTYHTSYALTTNEKLSFISLSSKAAINLYKNAWTNPLIFKKDIQKALFDIDYYKYFLHIADTISSDAERKFGSKIIENIRQMCEDGGFSPVKQNDDYFNTYIDLIYMRYPEFSEDVEIDQLAVLIKCIKETL